ncbi:MAG: hypothetical protein CM1200mP18_20870 [Gammaproteobacteria bacterium]|nr:MAG: hypothetical protein CM1200mP18_20870 [Gammaproteobacteria bacterium]
MNTELPYWRSLLFVPLIKIVLLMAQPKRNAMPMYWV